MTSNLISVASLTHQLSKSRKKFLASTFQPIFLFSLQDVCHHANYLQISVTDKDCVGTFDVGGCLVDLRKLMDGEKVGPAHSATLSILFFNPKLTN